MSNRTKYLNDTMRQYILDNIDNSGYSKGTELLTDKDKAEFLYTTFKIEYSWSIERYGQYKAFTEWLQGLPSAISIDFTHYDIIQLAIKWGSLPVRHTDKQAEKILDNWFHFVMVHSFKLFKKYKIEVSQ